jgi:hypothetical protein
MLLLILTVIAVSAAIAAAAYAWRIANVERERSDARVAALSAAIDDKGPAAAFARSELQRAEEAGHRFGREDGAEAGQYGGSVAATMFERAPRSGLQGRPLLKVGVGFTMAVLLIVLIAMSGERERASAEGPRATTQERSTQKLELLSMRHARAGSALTVTGLVRNGGAGTTGSIMAVVFVFDRDGGFVASGRAPLEFGAIARGDQSPFQVTIPQVTDVGKYSVSFRTQTGIVPHVDLRRTLQVSN